MKTQADILYWMRNELITSNTITNWHLNDQFTDFWEEFFKDEPLLNVRKKFTYYANILVKQGVLEKAQRVGIGCGGLFEWGARTQTIWKKVQIDKKIEEVETDSKGRVLKRNEKGSITHIDGKSIYLYTKDELYQFMMDRHS